MLWQLLFLFSSNKDLILLLSITPIRGESHSLDELRLINKGLCYHIATTKHTKEMPSQFEWSPMAIGRTTMPARWELCTIYALTVVMVAISVPIMIMVAATMASLLVFSGVLLAFYHAIRFGYGFICQSGPQPAKWNISYMRYFPQRTSCTTTCEEATVGNICDSSGRSPGRFRNQHRHVKYTVNTLLVTWKIKYNTSKFP
jgi:hypothetical protein